MGMREIPALPGIGSDGGSATPARRRPASSTRDRHFEINKEEIVADINVERKGPSIWPWIIGLLVLALLIWALIEMFGDRDQVAVTDRTVATEPATAEQPVAPVGPTDQPAVFATFQRDCVQVPAGQEMGLQHEYTANCLRLLADGLEDVVRRDPATQANLQPQVQAVRQRADQLQQTAADNVQHANMARDAFTSAATAMENIHQQRFTGEAQLQPQVQQVRQSAEAINPQTPLLEQNQTVNQFFQRSWEVLQTMDRRAMAPR
jgi:hypothetical protein